MLGQEVCSMSAQLGDVCGGGGHVGHQVLLPHAVLVDDCNGLLDSLEGGQMMVDLCQLYSEAPQLHLQVQVMTRRE